MEENPTRICELIVGLGDVEVLGVDDAPGGPLEVHIGTRSRPVCGGCGGSVWSKDAAVVALVDLPAFGRLARLVRYTHRWSYFGAGCAGGSFTETEEGIAPARGALTAREAQWASMRRCAGVAAGGAPGTGAPPSSRCSGARCSTMSQVAAPRVPPRGSSRGPRCGATVSTGTSWTSLAPTGAPSMQRCRKPAGRRPVPRHPPSHKSVDEVRRRTQNDTPGSRGRKDDPLYRARRLLIAAHERLSDGGDARLRGLLAAGDPHGETRLARHAKETLSGLYDVDYPQLAECYAAELADDLKDASCPPEMRRLGRTMARWHTLWVPETRPWSLTSRDGGRC